MLLDAAVLTLIVGVLAGGRMSRLKDFDLRAPGLFIIAALAKIAVAILGSRGSPLAATAGGPLNIASYLFLLLALLLNRHLWGMRIAAVGVLLNFLVIAANDGGMPVDRNLAVQAGNAHLIRLLDSPYYVTHPPLTPATRLKPLADVLKLPLLAPRPRFFAPGSIGDITVTIGACWLILTAVGAFGLRARARPGPGEDDPAAPDSARRDLPASGEAEDQER